MVLNLVRSRASPDALRRVGSVWDVLTFWPRRFHPFAVRPYSAIAVEQLRALLVDEDGVDDAWRQEPLTVLAHSQGTMLVVAALAPHGSGSGGSRVRHLVTVGSPLRPLYMRAFPAYIDEALLRDVSSALEPPARWTNVFRFTDHVGRSVFCEEPAWVVPSGLPRAGHPRGLWWVEAGPPLGPGHRDCAVADPESNQLLLDGHNRYWTDRRVRGVIDDAPAGRV
jgi:pimeloyl-ACP methyl ester carboxylesterase